MKSNKIINKLVIITLLIIMAVSTVLLGAVYKNRVEEKKYSSNNKDISDKIAESSYALYHSIMSKKEGKNVKPSDYLLSKDATDEERSIVDADVISWQEGLEDNLKNLEYYVIDKEKNIVEKRQHNPIELFLNKSNKKGTTDYMKTLYSFYISIDYDANGKRTIVHQYRIKGAEGIMLDFGVQDEYNLSKIKNMKYVFAIPRLTAYEDDISNVFIENNTEVNIMPFIGIMFSILIFIGVIFIPYRREKEYLGFEIISKRSLEGILIAYSIVCIGVFLLGYEIIYNLFNEVNKSTKSIIINVVISIEVFTVLIGVYLASLLFKHIIQVGVPVYLKENLFISKVILYLLNPINYIKDIDIKDKNNLRILAIVFVNFLVVMIFCIIGQNSILLAILYSLFVFYIIYDNLRKIKKDYGKLFDLTNKIANGNLNVEIDEDLGVFNEFKGEVEKIQSGLKVAVDKEVKSQKMKTELVSNVSHDLKTPLTSIITYVDLLKDEEITNEKRKEYLEILDMKSQRLQYLIEDLFEMSKATSGNIVLNKVDVDVVSLMKQTLLELDDKIKEANLIVKNNFPGDNEKIILNLDSQRMFRVFENLIMNITKYALSNSRVYINIDDNADKVDIVFRNIAKDELSFTAEDITERFIRGDKSRNTEGSGLGLSIAKTFVELQEGSFKVKVDGDLFKVIISFRK